MDRVQTLTDKLVQQLKEKADAARLLLTVQMLQSELLHMQQTTGASPVHVVINQTPSPTLVTENLQQENEFEKNKEPENSEASLLPKNEIQQEEKTVEVLQVDEAELEAELEEIKRNAEALNKISAQNKPQLLFDPIDDIPTMAHQQPVTGEPKKELHEILPTQQTASLNDKLKQAKMELSDSLQELPIKDLRKAIGINDRFLFINELFRGDETMYERSIKTINGFSIYPEAEYWIKRELKLKLGWNEKNEIVKQFDHLVKRRFL